MIPNIPEIKDKEKYSAFDLPREKVERAFHEAVKKVDKLAAQVGSRFPAEFSENNVYPTVDWTGWGDGFWAGILWHCFEVTGDEKYKNIMLSQIPHWTQRITEKIGVNHHDMGFLYSLSCVAAYKLDGNEEAKRAAIMAADHLITRYQEKGQFIQAWGNVSDPKDYRLIVDCLDRKSTPLNSSHWS